MPLCRPALCAAILLPCAAPLAAQPDVVPSPFELSRLQPGEPVWAPLARLRTAEADFRDTEQWGHYVQYRAMEEAWAGAHVQALRYADAPYPPRDSVAALPVGVRAVPAREAILRAADAVRVVMINERHHADADRLLTLALLRPLYDHGFRYFAAETFGHTDPALQGRGYPVDSSGTYTDTAVFGEVVREALRLGYTLVPYEITDEQREADPPGGLTRQQHRDRSQAQNLYAATFEQDAAAKVLVHAGYSHIEEEESEGWSPMAFYLRSLTGHDALTVDQTRLSERSAPGYEHPAYRAAAEAGLLASEPVVLLDSAGEPLRPASFIVDFQVFGSRTAYAAGRPTWMALGGRRTALDVAVPECAARGCFVEAVRPGESAAAVPLDRTEADGSGSVRLFLPPSEPVVVRTYAADGAPLQERTVSVQRATEE